MSPEKTTAPAQKTPPPAPPIQPPADTTPWWKHKRAIIVGRILLGIFIISLFSWWWLFRPYVATNDAKIVSTIIRLAPSGVSGRIDKVNVKEGDMVHQGDILVELDHRICLAQVKRAKARFSQISIDRNRIQRLVHIDSLPVTQLDAMEANYVTTEADLNVAEINLENTYLKSPVDGIIIQKSADVGNLLDPSQVAMLIADVDHAWVEAQIEETFIGAVHPGQKVVIKIDEGGKLTGHVKEVRKATASQFALIPIENSAGNFTKVVQRIPVKIELDPHPGKVLRSGQSVEVKIRVI